MPETALEIQSGAELLLFQPNTVEINHTKYWVLTGYEGSGRCFWCGGELKGKLKHYCYGHMKEYYQHFEWGSARQWCIERQGGICANCGENHSYSLALEAHHIVPLNGAPRYFSAFNLPWNLIGLCHDCHQEVHAAMRPPARGKDSWVDAKSRGQLIMSFT